MRDQAEKQRLYKETWKRVKGVYYEGFCVSEHNLQAALYAELRKELSSDSHVVVEPTWEIADGKAFPDLVIIEGGEITDIFELKFVPHHNAEWKEDIEKLFSYTEKPDERHLRHPVRLDPKTGQWKAISQYRRDVGGISSRLRSALPKIPQPCGPRSSRRKFESGIPITKNGTIGLGVPAPMMASGTLSLNVTNAWT